VSSSSCVNAVFNRERPPVSRKLIQAPPSRATARHSRAMRRGIHRARTEETPVQTVHGSTRERESPTRFHGLCQQGKHPPRLTLEARDATRKPPTKTTCRGFAPGPQRHPDFTSFLHLETTLGGRMTAGFQVFFYN
jgi:hypothetical protein